MRDHEQELEKHVKNRYNEINAEWLKFHLVVAMGSAIAIFCVEIIMLLVLYYNGDILCSMPAFLLKYVAFPTFCSGTILLISHLTYHSKKLSMSTKQYVISIILTILCFMLSSIHYVFVVVLATAICPIILTVMYENRMLTGTTALCSLILQFTSGCIVDRHTEKSLDDMYMMNVCVLLAILVFVWFICHLMIRFMRMKREIVIQNDIERYLLRREIVTDMLTNVGNRAALEQCLHNITADTSETYYLAMLDIDHFKEINDNYGHVTGDIVLRCVGQALTNISIHSDAFRFGGDEFCVLFTNCEKAAILSVLKQVQDTVSQCILKQTEQTVSISIGLVQYHSGLSVYQLIQAADQAMYSSKRKEDNSITVYENR